MGICCVYFVCVCASVCNERLDFLMDGPNSAAAVCPVEVSLSKTPHLSLNKLDMRPCFYIVFECECVCVYLTMRVCV